MFDDYLLVDVNHEATLRFEVRTAGAATVALTTCAAECGTEGRRRAAWEVRMNEWMCMKERI